MGDSGEMTDSGTNALARRIVHLIMLSPLMLGCSTTTSTDPQPPDGNRPDAVVAESARSDSDRANSSGTQSSQTESSRAESSRTESKAVLLSRESWPEIESAIPREGWVVVDFWSLACPPCLESFPTLVRLASDHGDRLRTVSVNLDYDGRKSRPPETYTDRIQNFLNESNAGPVIHYQSTTASDGVLQAIEAPSIPFVLVYRDGEAVRRFEDDGGGDDLYERDVMPYLRTTVLADVDR